MGRASRQAAAEHREPTMNELRDREGAHTEAGLLDDHETEPSAPSHYILATSPPADVQSRVLKHNDTFAIFDVFGDIKPGGLGEEGIFHKGTRFLSFLLLGLNEM